MQIILPKKLSTAMKVDPIPMEETVNPLFNWTAHWTNTWDDKPTPDLLVLVNHATRFTVVLHEVKKKDLKNIHHRIKDAMRNTLLAMHFHEDLVDAYMKAQGEVTFAKKYNPRITSWATHAGFDTAIYIGRNQYVLSGTPQDTLGTEVSTRIVNYGNDPKDAYYPYKAMRDALSALTEMAPYKTRAFELQVTLDLEKYTATRTILVPANLSLRKLHHILQHTFDWRHEHLYEFSLVEEETGKVLETLVEDTQYFEDLSTVQSLEGVKLSDYLPTHRHLRYVYDFGDYWVHEIQLLKVHEAYEGELPYLLSLEGEAPPENVGGVGGFLHLLDVLANPQDEEYEDYKDWVGYWTPKVYDWQKKPRVIRIY